MKRESAFDNFDRTMHDLMNVTHDEIQQELDAEKADKQKRKAKEKPSASDRDAEKTD